MIKDPPRRVSPAQGQEYNDNDNDNRLTDDGNSANVEAVNGILGARDPSPEEYEAVDHEHAASPKAASKPMNDDVSKEIYDYTQFKLRLCHFDVKFERVILDEAQDIKGHYLLLMKVSKVQEIFDVPTDPNRFEQVVTPGYDATAYAHVTLDNDNHDVPLV
ncbi:hypothetical protein DL769_007366 [Monosporascus sp. CRB-8-3]|nr:hypothetical protein DL769_007366 [Monosporascus sp. CRB-8-3]